MDHIGLVTTCFIHYYHQFLILYIANETSENNIDVNELTDKLDEKDTRYVLGKSFTVPPETEACNITLNGKVYHLRVSSKPEDNSNGSDADSDSDNSESCDEYDEPLPDDLTQKITT